MNREAQTTLDHPVTASGLRVGGVVVAALLLAAASWAYWPAIQSIVAAWNRDPDYSHGYLVGPIALLFLWLRRRELDVDRLSPSWFGAVLVVAASCMRAASGVYFLGPVDAWTIPVTIAGVVLLVFGWHGLRWCLPSIAFLYFMIPIPYSAETWLSVPLQGFATWLSTEALQLLGQPAIAEGNVIWLEEQPLEVAQACSGLRILVGVFALAFAFVLFSRWALWQKGIVLLTAVPVALAANAMRIVATGLLYRVASGEAARYFSHELAGFVMIPLAAGMFWLLLIYIEHLFPKVQVLSPTAVINAAGGRG